MRKTLLIVSLCLGLASCKQIVEKQSKVFYVIKEGQNYLKNKKFKDNPPPPVDIVYGNLNFILIGNDKIYFHPKSYYFKCGFGKDKKVIDKVPLIGLKPEDIKEIRKIKLESFLDSAFKAGPLSHPYIVITISSLTDTIKNPAFEQISEFLAKDINRYNIRRLTNEEKYAINARINGVGGLSNLRHK
jgi:hypothetical protein